jgi:hypothetical protein
MFVYRGGALIDLSRAIDKDPGGIASWRDARV